MKNLLLLASALFILEITPLFAQVELCQGAYFTEAQGKEFLSKNIPKNKVGWEKRAAAIRANMLEGMDLLPLPPKPTSQPIIHSRRVMDGYTVENIAFESMPGVL
jgi:hypothetical protein